VLLCASESVAFDEIASPLARLLADARDLVGQLPPPRLVPPATLDGAVSLSQQSVPPSLEERRLNFQTAAEIVVQEHNAYTVSVQAALAGSIVHLKVFLFCSIYPKHYCGESIERKK